MSSYHQESQKVSCPYCGEMIEILVDPSESQQDYIEDCFVCCRPIEFQIQIANEEISVQAFAENE